MKREEGKKERERERERERELRMDALLSAFDTENLLFDLVILYN